MNLWDTHCHIYQEYYEDISTILKDASNVGVTHYILSGVDLKSNCEVLNFVSKNSNCYGVIGIHPEEILDYKVSDLLFLKENINSKNIIGIGEIGLDYHYSKDNKKEQKEIFETQLKIAEEYNLPVVIHSREATLDTIELLKKYSVKGIIHSFSGSIEIARIYIQMGFKLGINGVVTFKNSKLKDLLPEIFPHIVLETDSPYLTPHPFRGTQNSPKYIRNIAEFIADYLKISISQVERVTNDNIKHVFDKVEQ